MTVTLVAMVTTEVGLVKATLLNLVVGRRDRGVPVSNLSLRQERQLIVYWVQLIVLIAQVCQ